MEKTMESALAFDKKEKIKIIDIITCIFVAYYFSGHTGDLFLYVSLGIFLVWLMCVYFVDNEYIYSCLKDKKLIFLFVIIAYSSICGLFKASILYLLKQIGASLLLFSPIFIFNYYRNQSKKSIKLIICFFILCWLFFAIKSIIFYTVNVGSAKALTADSNAYGNIAIGGGLLLAYATAIFSTLLVDCILQNKKRWLCVILLLISIYLLIKTESTVTLICAFCGMIFSFITAKGKSLQKFIRTSVLVVFVAIFVFNVTTIANWIVDIGNSLNSTFGSRISSFGYALMLDETGGAYALDRARILLESFNTFIEHPIFGVCYQHGNGYYHVEGYGIGNHCAWFDFLANYGLIFGVVFLFIYILQAKEVLKNKNSFFSKGWVFCLFLMGCFNPIKAFQPNMIIFFLIPALDMIMQKRATKQETK